MSKRTNIGIIEFTYFSLYYFVFMIIESLGNDRTGEVVGNSYVVPFYVGSLIATALGYFIYGILANRVKNKHIFFISIASIVGTIGVYTLDTSYSFMPICFCLMIFLGFIGGHVHNLTVNPFNNIKKSGTILGVFMAFAIVIQFVVQNYIKSTYFNMALILVCELLLVVFGLIAKKEETTQDNLCSTEIIQTNKKSLLLVILLVAIMSLILGLNDEIMVNLNAKNETNLFSAVRLVYAVGLVIAGIIADMMKRKLMPLVTGCTMLLSMVAVSFLGEAKYYNFNMSVMYFYSGFYVVYLTYAFLEISYKCHGNKKALYAGMGRIVRSVATAIITAAMYFVGGNYNGTVLITINCLLSVLIFVIMTLGGMLYLKEPHRDKKRTDDEYWNIFAEKYKLTNREKDVAYRLINTNKILQDIADELYISRRVVQRHITSIYKKTETQSRTELMHVYINIKENP